MATKEARQKKEEAVKIFEEVHKIASIGATLILREALDKYKVRFDELMAGKGKK